MTSVGLVVLWNELLLISVLCSIIISSVDIDIFGNHSKSFTTDFVAIDRDTMHSEMILS